jgi:hypothetical protein
LDAENVGGTDMHKSGNPCSFRSLANSSSAIDIHDLKIVITSASSGYERRGVAGKGLTVHRLGHGIRVRNIAFHHIDAPPGQMRTIRPRPHKRRHPVPGALQFERDLAAHEPARPGHQHAGLWIGCRNT